MLAQLIYSDHTTLTLENIRIYPPSIAHTITPHIGCSTPVSLTDGPHGLTVNPQAAHRFTPHEHTRALTGWTALVLSPANPCASVPRIGIPTQTGCSALSSCAPHRPTIPLTGCSALHFGAPHGHTIRLTGLHFGAPHGHTIPLTGYSATHFGTSPRHTFDSQAARPCTLVPHTGTPSDSQAAQPSLWCPAWAYHPTHRLLCLALWSPAWAHHPSHRLLSLALWRPA